MNILERTINLIAPHRCILCHLEGLLLCEACSSTTLKSIPSRCYRCHRASAGSKVCTSCRSSVFLKHVWIATEYEDAAKKLLYRLKFSRAQAGAACVADVIEGLLPALPKDIIVTHVPTASSRIRVRGYDQSSLIAKTIASRRGWQHSSLLIRLGNARQVGSGRLERFKQLEQALKPINLAQIKNKHILLIDDVTTTGATLEAATKVLKKSGAKTVDAAVFAQPVI